MSTRLAGRHAILTGAGGAIGSAVLNAFLEQGATCMAIDMADSPNDTLQDLLERYPDALAYARADVARRDDITDVVQASLARFGPATTLFNNAGVFDLAPLLDSDEAMYDRIFDVNVRGMFFTMQTVLAQMVEHPEQSNGRGAVINMSSQAGRRGQARVAHYCASKAAVISYTQSAALAMAPHGIRVNSIAPGVIDTPMWDQVDALHAALDDRPIGERKRQVGAEVPLGRIGLPQDIVGAAVFLASDDARYITAQTLNVDGGNVMS